MKVSTLKGRLIQKLLERMENYEAYFAAEDKTDGMNNQATTAYAALIKLLWSIGSKDADDEAAKSAGVEEIEVLRRRALEFLETEYGIKR